MDQQHNQRRAMLQVLWETQEAENQRVQSLLFPGSGLPTPPPAPKSDINSILASEDSTSSSDSSSTDSSSSTSAEDSSSEDSRDEFLREPPNKRSRYGMRFRKRRLLSLYRTQTGKTKLHLSFGKTKLFHKFFLSTSTYILPASRFTFSYK